MGANSQSGHGPRRHECTHIFSHQSTVTSRRDQGGSPRGQSPSSRRPLFTKHVDTAPYPFCRWFRHDIACPRTLGPWERHPSSLAFNDPPRELGEKAQGQDVNVEPEERRRSVDISPASALRAAKLHRRKSRGSGARRRMPRPSRPPARASERASTWRRASRRRRSRPWARSRCSQYSYGWTPSGAALGRCGRSCSRARRA